MSQPVERFISEQRLKLAGVAEIIVEGTKSGPPTDRTSVMIIFAEVRCEAAQLMAENPGKEDLDALKDFLFLVDTVEKVFSDCLNLDRWFEIDPNARQRWQDTGG